jgi:hypothetical protein
VASTRKQRLRWSRGCTKLSRAFNYLYSQVPADLYRA